MIDTKKTKHSYFSKIITLDQAKDTGMAMVLLFLLAGFFSKYDMFYNIAIALQIINMIVPSIYKPLARIWIGFSYLLGTIISKILLTGVFFSFVLLVGMIRRILGFDTLNIKIWKKDNSSVFKIRNHVFESKDIENPY